MRLVIQNVYTALMRLQGATALGFVILLVVGAFTSNLPGLLHPLPILLTLMAVGIGVCFVQPGLAPRLITQPGGLASGFAVAALHVVAPLIFMVPVMTAVVAFEIAEPMSRYFAVGASGAIFVVSGVLWWLGLVLAIWNDAATDPTVPNPA